MMSNSGVRTFHGSADIKEALLKRISDGIAAGELQPGFASDKNLSELCFCLVENTDAASHKEFFAQASEEIGLPKWLLEVYLSLFERLPVSAAKNWALSFVECIPAGIDMEFSLYAFFADFLLSDDIGAKAICRNSKDASLIIRELAGVFKAVSSAQSLLDKQPEIAAIGQRSNIVELRIRESNARTLAENEGITYEEFYAIQRVLFSIDWMVIDRPTPALTSMAAAMTKQLDLLASTKVLITRGRRFLRPNFNTAVGGFGFSMAAEMEKSYIKMAGWAISWLETNYLGNSISVKQAEAKLTSPIPVAVEDNVLLNENRLQFDAGTKVPNRYWRIGYHFFLQSSGFILDTAGWALLLMSLLLFFNQVEPAPNFLHRLLKGLICIAGYFAGRLIIKTGRRLSAGYGWYWLMDSGKKPVVYLRGFDDDLLTDREERFSILRLIWVGRTVEEQLVMALKSFGPVIALGRPGSLFSAPGASKIYFPQANWRRSIIAVLKYSSFVVKTPGYNEGSRWEITQIEKYVSPQNFMVYIPRAKGKQKVRYDHSREIVPYYTFLSDLLAVTFNVRPGEFTNDNRFIWFSPKWKPRPLKMVEDADWYLFKTYDTLIAELNPVITHFSLPEKHVVWKTRLRIALILIIVLLSFFELNRLFSLNSKTL